MYTLSHFEMMDEIWVFCSPRFSSPTIHPWKLWWWKKICADGKIWRYESWSNFFVAFLNVIVVFTPKLKIKLKNEYASTWLVMDYGIYIQYNDNVKKIILRIMWKWLSELKVLISPFFSFLKRFSLCLWFFCKTRK